MQTLSKCRDLVPLGQATINLGNLWAYHKLMDLAEKDRIAYDNLMITIEAILDKYAQQFPELLDERARLQLDIRLLSKGTPVTEPMDAATARPVLTSNPEYNEQQYNAFTELLNKAYKKVAMLAHPDRPGGSSEAFKAVTDAYADRDLTHLTALYIELLACRNLYWRQTEEAVYHASTEFERPKVKLQCLKQNPVFEIARLHQCGNKMAASIRMECQLRSELVALQTEIQYLTRNQNVQDHENQSQSSANQIDEGWQEDAGSESEAGAAKEIQG